MIPYFISFVPEKKPSPQTEFETSPRTEYETSSRTEYETSSRTGYGILPDDNGICGLIVNLKDKVEIKACYNAPIMSETSSLFPECT